MKIYSNEQGNGESVLIIDKKESKILIEMLEAAVKSNKRKTSWAALLKKTDLIACY